jgi:hypothetical protein
MEKFESIGNCYVTRIKISAEKLWPSAYMM